MELAAVVIGSLCSLWFIYMKNICQNGCICHHFVFLFVDRCRSPNFLLVWLVINWDVFVLSSVRSKNQPRSLPTASAAAVSCCFLCCCVCGCLRPKSWVPLLQSITGVSVENGNVLGSGTLQIGVFFLVGLEWSKTTMFHFAQSLKSCPPSSVKPIAELYPKATANKSNTCVLRALLTKAWKLPECCLWSTPSVGTHRHHWVSCFISSYLWVSDPFVEREEGHVIEHDHTCQDKC